MESLDDRTESNDFLNDDALRNLSESLDDVESLCCLFESFGVCVVLGVCFHTDSTVSVHTDLLQSSYTFSSTAVYSVVVMLFVVIVSRVLVVVFCCCCCCGGCGCGGCGCGGCGGRFTRGIVSRSLSRST